MYTKVTYDLGEVKEIQKYYPGNYGAPGCPREKKRKRTPEEIKRQNETNKVRKVQRLILANFSEGDLHLILTYRKDLRPETAAEANALRAKFLSKMKQAYKKAGVEFKYIAVTEIGSKGAVHHHIIINNPDEVNTSKTVQQNWKFGQQYLSPLYEEGEFENLASYLVKDETKESCKGTSYSRSRNLIIPEPRREKICSRTWKDPPKVPKGWEIIKDTLFNGFNPVTGHPYQRYMIRRTDEGQHLYVSDHKRTKAAAGVRSLHPGGRNGPRADDEDLQDPDRRKPKRSKP